MGSLGAEYQIPDDDLTTALAPALVPAPDPAPAPVAVAAGGGGEGGAAPGALRLLNEPEERGGLQVQAVAGAGAGGGGGGQRVVELRDRRLQASCFFQIWGCSTVIYVTLVNPKANPEFLFLGFALLTTGAVLAQLTLAGGRAARAAARLEEFLRGFF